MHNTLKGQKQAYSGEKNRQLIIYIAGPMTAQKGLNRPAFARAADDLRNAGYIVLNPGTLPIGMPASAYMPICLAMIDAADAICMLPGWSHSNGANLELQYAKYQGKDAFILEDLLTQHNLITLNPKKGAV